MAHFRMHTQIRDQTSAFLRGFRTLVNPEWLSLFSTPEVPPLVLYPVFFFFFHSPTHFRAGRLGTKTHRRRQGAD